MSQYIFLPFVPFPFHKHTLNRLLAPRMYGGKVYLFFIISCHSDNFSLNLFQVVQVFSSSDKILFVIHTESVFNFILLVKCFEGWAYTNTNPLKIRSYIYTLIRQPSVISNAERSEVSHAERSEAFPLRKGGLLQQRGLYINAKSRA